jgi:Cu2+-exporting ATPase
VSALTLDDRALLAPFTTWAEDGSAQSQFQVGGMYCGACSYTIESALAQLDGVRRADVNAASARLALRWDPSRLHLADVLACVERAGYQVVPDVAASARALRAREWRLMLWRVFVSSFVAMQVMMLAIPVYVAEPGEMSPDIERLLQWGSWVLCLVMLAFAAGPFFKSAWQQLRARRLGMDVPVALGLSVTFIASSGALFDPGGLFGHAVYFDTLSMFVSFLLIGRWFEMKARHRAAEALESVAGALPQAAERLLPDGRSERVMAEHLRVGDRLRVAAGEAFAADGLVEQGESSVNEALLSGESAPVLKQPGAEVVAGSINLEGPLVLRVTRVGADTTAQGIVRLMQQAQSQRVEGSLLLERVARGFTAAVLALAMLAALAWLWIDPSRALGIAVAVLIVTCPCALTLAAPAAWLAAAGALARRGLLLVRLDLLERLAEVDTVVFDKTGTLSEERPVLAAQWAEGDTVEALLPVARRLAAHSRHPYSQALVDAGGALPWPDLRELPGRGLEAVDEAGRTWRLGAPAWVAELSGLGADTRAQVACGRPGALLALSFEERPREGAEAAVAALRALGLQVHLLSGDAEGATAAMAMRLGIERWLSGARPADKLATVRRLQSQGRKVLMVGDGINDAPVLAAADLRVVMGQGAMLARSNADALLLSNRLADLPAARRLALRTRRVLRQNLAWAALYNFACVPLALAGRLPPLAAGIGMAASSLLVVLNAQRLASRSE